MSSVGHHDVSDKGKEKKAEPQAAIQLQNQTLVGSGARFEFNTILQQSDLLKAATLSKHAAPIRTIAPAPGLAMGAASANKIISQHALVSKTAMGTALETLSLQPSTPAGSQTVAVNLSTQVAPISQAASQALHITMTTVSSQSLHSLTLPAALGHTSGPGLVPAQTFSTQVPGGIEVKDKSRVAVMTPGTLTDQERVRNTMSMASLIRGAVSLPQGLPQAHPQVSLALAQAQGHSQGTGQGISNPSQTSIIHALPPSHIPRGAAAASALAAAKAGPVATPMLRPQSTVTQLSSNNALLPTMAQKQPRPSFRPATPPATPIVTMTTTHSQPEIQRPAQGHMMTMSGSSAVQISGLQPLGAGLQGRPVLSQTPKGSIAVSQAAQPLGFSTQTQKVVMSQSQLLTSVTVPNPKLQGPNLALNLAPPSGVVRTQKILATQVPAIPTQTQGPLPVAGPQTLNLTQSLTRPPKVIVTHAQSIPPGAVVVNTTPKIGPPAGVNQTLQRPQKVLMSNMPSTVTMPTTVPITIGNLPKTIAGVGVHNSTVTQISSMSVVTSVTTSSIPSIPFNSKQRVKLQTQRTNQPQVAMSTSQHPQQVADQSLQVPSLQSHREVSASPQVRLPVAQGATLSASQSQIQASLFGLASAPRPSSSNSQCNLPVAVATTTPVTTQSAEVRNPAPDRSNIAQHLAFPLPEYNMPQANYFAPYNLVYQPHAVPAGSTIRPGIVPAQQQANLAATLQAATQAVTTVTGSQPGVRINPSVMVSVDPSHHTTISMAAAAAQFAGSKPSEVPQVSTTTASVAPSVASAHPPSVAQSSVSHTTHSTNQQAGSINSQPTNASPRPSILRKRPHEGSERVMIVKRNLLSSVNAADTSNSSTGDSLHHAPNTTSPKPSVPCDPMRENSQSSTDTASSAESTPQSGVNTEVKVKQEPLDVVENGAAASLAMFGQLQNNIEASPRKKPRKQRLHASEELKDGGSSDEELDKLAEEDIKKELEWMTEDFIRTDMKEYVDEEGVRWTRDRRRPPVNLMNHYACNWKAKNNHYQKYQDVKAKEERRPTVNELANQKGIHQKASGWKVYHLAAQLEELMDMERDVFHSMSSVQECIAPKHIAKNPTMEDDISMVHELTQGNIQRCQLVMDQLDEAKSSMVKVLDHKQRIIDIINKHHSKRPVKKKERP